MSTAWDTHIKNDSLTREFIKNHHTVVMSIVKHTLPLSPIPKHLEFIYPKTLVRKRFGVIIFFTIVIYFTSSLCVTSLILFNQNIIDAALFAGATYIRKYLGAETRNYFKPLTWYTTEELFSPSDTPLKQLLCLKNTSVLYQPLQLFCTYRWLFLFSLLFVALKLGS